MSDELPTAAAWAGIIAAIFQGISIILLIYQIWSANRAFTASPQATVSVTQVVQLSAPQAPVRTVDRERTAVRPSSSDTDPWDAILYFLAALAIGAVVVSA